MNGGVGVYKEDLHLADVEYVKGENGQCVYDVVCVCVGFRTNKHSNISAC